MTKPIDVQIKFFDITKYLKRDSKVLVVGKPDSGKSTLIKDIAYNVCDVIPVGNVWSGTEFENKSYAGMFPDTAISSDFDLIRYKNCNIRQRLLTHRRHPNPWAIDIIDDCPGKLYRDKEFIKTFKLGRHWSKLTVIGIHRAVDVAPDLRGATDYSFLFRETHPTERKALYNAFGALVNQREFEKIFDQCTENYKCLVVDNRSKSNNLSEIYYWYKAEQHPGFKFGSPQFWEECNEDRNEGYNEEKEMLKKSREE